MHFARWKLYVTSIKKLLQINFKSDEKNFYSKYKLQTQNTRII